MWADGRDDLHGPDHYETDISWSDVVVILVLFVGCPFGAGYIVLKLVGLL